MITAPHEAAAICATLKTWLLDHAFTVWWLRGADQVSGGCHERLQLDGRPTGEPRRARLHPRQMYAYAIGHELGWSGPAKTAVQHALQFQVSRYRRPDGLFRALVAADGQALGDDVILYDQAFALLGYAAAYDVLGDEALRDDARALLSTLRRAFAHATGGFDESAARDTPLTSNSHMHLFEAALAWLDLDRDPEWQALAEQIVELALARFIDPASGFLLEFFDAQWQPISGDAGRRVEPGHQFEWAWLLLRWFARSDDECAKVAALRLIQRTEAHGVDAATGAALNALTNDACVLDAKARLWPQTERLKAAVIAAEATQQARYWDMAVQAARVLTRYLEVPLTGLWRDTLLPTGEFVDEPAPASSFYHLACAIAEFDKAVNRAPRKPPID